MTIILQIESEDGRRIAQRDFEWQESNDNKIALANPNKFGDILEVTIWVELPQINGKQTYYVAAEENRLYSFEEAFNYGFTEVARSTAAESPTSGLPEDADLDEVVDELHDLKEALLRPGQTIYHSFASGESLKNLWFYDEEKQRPCTPLSGIIVRFRTQMSDSPTYELTIEGDGFKKCPTFLITSPQMLKREDSVEVISLPY